jgi:hypothetical protein
MTPIRLILIAVALVLSASIVWASLNAPLFASFGIITANPWGVVTLIDLYSGFLVASVVIWVLEPSRPLALALILLTLVLGNVVTLVWLAWRGLNRLRRT